MRGNKRKLTILDDKRQFRLGFTVYRQWIGKLSRAVLKL